MEKEYRKMALEIIALSEKKDRVYKKLKTLINEKDQLTREIDGKVKERWDLLTDYNLSLEKRTK